MDAPCKQCLHTFFKQYLQHVFYIALSVTIECHERFSKGHDFTMKKHKYEYVFKVQENEQLEESMSSVHPHNKLWLKKYHYTLKKHLDDCS